MTNEELKQFKAAISITSVAQSLGISVSHGRFRCLFPQRHTHGDRTPSVSISEERGTFRCWVCDDVRGDVISLVQIVKDCSFVEALSWLMEQYPFLVPPTARKEMERLSQRTQPAAVGRPSATSAPVGRVPLTIRSFPRNSTCAARCRIRTTCLRLTISQAGSTCARAWSIRSRF